MPQYSPSTLQKLKQNKHYKLSEKQRRQLEMEEKREKMIEFGAPQTHPQNVPTHTIQHTPVKRTST